MTTPSFKQLIKDGTIRRADAMRVPFENIIVEPGFNLREEGPELEESIEQLAQFMFDGGQIPPLEVRPTDGGVIIVDGHRRYRAIEKCRELGAQIDLVDVVPFRGNDVDRVARIMTSAEGRSLSPLETSRGYKRLDAYGMSAEEIAAKVHKTRQHVEQLLILANANADVHAMVRSGVVSAATAIDSVRKHGENAGAFLAAKFDEVKAAGKSKVTNSSINGKALPRKLADSMVESFDMLSSAVGAQQRAYLSELEQKGDLQSHSVPMPAAVVLDLLNMAADIDAERKRQADKAREKAAKAAQIDIEDAA